MYLQESRFFRSGALISYHNH